MALTSFMTGVGIMNALSKEVYLAIYDDDDTGDVDTVHASDGVKDDIRSAHVWVVSAIKTLYEKIPDGSDPQGFSDLLWSCEREYCKYLAFKRRPEYTRSTGRTRDRDEAKERATELLEQIRAGLLQIVPEDKPPEPVPENLGGIVYDGGQRVFLDGPNGTNNSGDF